MPPHSSFHRSSFILPNILHPFKLLVGAALRSEFRWAVRHIYTWLVLGPVVLGLTWFTISRLSDNLPAWRPSLGLALSLATLFVLCLTALNLSRASIEIYHLKRPESFFESFPLSPALHLNAALAIRITRTLVAGVVVIEVWSLSGETALTNPRSLPPLALFVILTALTQLFAGLNWIHWGHRRNLRAAAIALVIIIFTSIAAGELLVLSLEPNSVSRLTGVLSMAASAFLCALVYLITQRLHARWRAADIEFVKRLQDANRRSIFSVRIFRRWFGAKVAAELARDLQLTVRAFSSAVYVALGISVLWLFALFIALTARLLPLAASVIPLGPDDASGFNATWRPSVMAVKAGCALVVVSLSALTPVLVAYELPHLWLERSLGTTGLEIWQAKLWYTRMVSAPAPIIVWLLGFVSAEVPLYYAIPLLAESLFLWWLVSSLMGSLSFEMPNRPGLAIIFMVTVGLAGGALAALLWPFGIIIYFQAMHGLPERGRARVRYYLITEDD